MTSAYAKQLRLRIWKTDIWAQKIDRSSLDSFGMIIADFQIIDKLGRVWFLQERFLLPNTTMKIIS